MNKEYSYAIDNCALPWLMLDFQFRWEDILHEVEQLDEWIPYRESSGKNWSSLALHGISGEFGSVYHEELEHVRYDWTSIADKCPKTKDFLQNRAGIISHERTRFMKIDPGGSIFLHNDRDIEDQPLTLDIMGPSILHFSIQHPKGCDFHVSGWGNIPIDNGSTWLFSNVWNHECINNSDKPRYHILANGCKKDSKFWNPIIKRSWKNFIDKYNNVKFQ